MQSHKYYRMNVLALACVAWGLAVAGLVAEELTIEYADRVTADLKRMEQASQTLLGELQGVLQEAEVLSKQIRLERTRGKETSAARNRLSAEADKRAKELDALMARIKALTVDVEDASRQLELTRELRGQLSDLQRTRIYSECRLADLHAARMEYERRIREAQMQIRELEQRRHDFDRQVKNIRSVQDEIKKTHTKRAANCGNLNKPLLPLMSWKQRAATGNAFGGVACRTGTAETEQADLLLRRQLADLR